MEYFDQPVTELKGIGPKKAEKLKKLNIFTIRDLIFNFPRQFEDRAQIKKIYQLEDGEKVTVSGIITGMTRRRAGSNRSLVTINIVDEGSKARLIFFNMDYILNTFKKGDRILAFGQVKKNKINSTPELSNCEIEYYTDDPKNLGRIVPVYSLTSGISNKEISTMIRKAWEEIDFEIKDYLPNYIREKYKLADLNFAIRNVHFPKDRNALRAAVYRIIFEEFLVLQLGLFIYKSGKKTQESIIIEKSNLLDNFEDKLSFKLTSAQKRALNDILNDMGAKEPMNRLIQGDVGSGKTAVSMLACINTALQGYQSAMMAPTEILASQHFESFTSFLADSGIKLGLLTGSLKEKEKQRTLDEINNGEIDIVIGTHALIQEGVNFKNLALVVTDEQHRFGVNQRAVFAGKGMAANVLVMTATPIPRTLALILYGDLDISIIDQLPPGRKEIKTDAINQEKRPYIYSHVIGEEIKKGRQVYVVCPLVEESEFIEAISAIDLYEEISKTYESKFKVGLIHGKMKQKEKDNVMLDFKNGKIDILVATTVIEVGVNVPNASLMIIENAERFGLAQLHQLRGRVGRASHQSRCILIYHKDTDLCKKRMAIMEATNDGFKISEKDLEIRGTGEFFGTRQHGLPELKLANLFVHISILQKAQEVARAIISEDPLLERKENKKLKEFIACKFGQSIESFLILN